VPGSFYSCGDPALMSSTEATFPAGVNFTTIANKATQIFKTFPIQDFGFIGTKDTDFAPGLETHRAPG
jgi:hypothetical protein